MSGQMQDEWSAPSLHASASFQPPIDHGSPMDAMWSTPVYIGRRGKPIKANEPAETKAVSEASVEDRDSSRQLLVNSRTLAIANLTSRLTGFVRSSLLVAALGIHAVGDAYNGANNFPNMVYELLLGGVLSSVLIPLLVGAQQRDPDEGVGYMQRLLSLATVALGIMTVGAVACAPLLAHVFSPPGDQRSLTAFFAVLLLPEIFFYGVGALFMAVLNVRDSYGPAAWASVLNNVVMIATIAVFFALPGPISLTPSSITTAQVLVLGIGTTLGIAAQAFVLLPALRRSGFRWKWRFRARPNEVGRLGEVGVLALWVLGYVVASQVGVTVVQIVGQHHGVFTVFTQADLLLQVPYGILVVSLLTALMPRLARAATQGRTDAVVDDLGLGARLSALTLIPVTAGLIVLGPVLNVVLFAYHRTTVADARGIGVALAVSAFGLFPFALVMLQMRVFYAMRDGRTPTLINIAVVATKVALILICASVFDSKAQIANSLTISTSASYVVGAVLGHFALTRRLGSLGFSPVLRTAGKILVASCVGGVVAFVAVQVSERVAGTAHAGSLLGLILGSILGVVALCVVLWRMRLPEIALLRGMLAR